MANLALVTANRVYVVEAFEQMTLPAAEAITAGEPVRIDTANGRFTGANASSAAEGRAYGIATKTVAAGVPVTALRRGVMDGFYLSGLAYDDPVYLSDTDGRIADTTGTLDVAIGRVIPATGVPTGTSYDRLLLVDFAAAAGGAGAAGGITQVPVTYRQAANGDLADEAFFIADRAYVVDSIREVHSAAGTHSAAVSLQVTKDTGTDAPGAGTDLLSTAFDLKGTANTVQSAALTSDGAALTLAAGNRLSVDYAGVLTTVAGVVVTAMLTPA
jgi:hypothetical protein